MADQKRWYKLWHTALDDDDLLLLPPEDRWRWVALGLYMSVHGTRGTMDIHPANAALSVAFACAPGELLAAIKRLPNVLVSESEKRNDKISVTIANWNKYQHDTTNQERQARNRHKKRGEERRGEETFTLQTPPIKDSKNQTKQRAKKEIQEATTWDTSWRQAPWPSIRALIALYNDNAPADWPLVKTASNGISEKIAQYLKQFPKREWWECTFRNCRDSEWCKRYKGGGLGWLLQKGKYDQIENCAKAHDGNFA